MLLSLIISTYDRPALLSQLLESLLPQPEGLPAEILVIDNHPSLSAYPVAQGAGVKYVAEEKTGLSFARNRGAQEAQGEFLLFLDDDALCPMGFLRAVQRMLTSHNPDCFGGPVLPRYEEPPPAWFPEQYERRVHAARSGLTHLASLSGANFGMRRALFLKLGGFDTARGMAGKQLRFMEERALLDRYRRLTPAEQQKVYYDLDCAVLHATPPPRLQLRYQMRRQFKSHLDRAAYMLSLAPSPLHLRVTLIPYFLGGMLREGKNLLLQKTIPFRQRLARFAISNAGRAGLLLGLLSWQRQHAIAAAAEAETIEVMPEAAEDFFARYNLSARQAILFTHPPGLRLLAQIRLRWPHLRIGLRNASLLHRLFFEAVDAG